MLRSEPVDASSEASAGLNRTLVIESAPHENSCVGSDRLGSHTCTLELQVANSSRVQWWSIPLQSRPSRTNRQRAIHHQHRRVEVRSTYRKGSLEENVASAWGRHDTADRQRGRQAHH